VTQEHDAHDGRPRLQRDAEHLHHDLERAGEGLRDDTDELDDRLQTLDQRLERVDQGAKDAADDSDDLAEPLGLREQLGEERRERRDGAALRERGDGVVDGAAELAEGADDARAGGGERFHHPLVLVDCALRGGSIRL
jgi:hypothetical protein